MRTLTIVGLLVWGLFVWPAGSALGHESRAIDQGQYELEVGFIDEPAITNQLNGLYLKVVMILPEGTSATASPEIDAEHAEKVHAGEGIGVLALFDTLEAEVILGDQRMALPLAPGAEPGEYVSPFIPTQPGDYTFHIWGDIEGTPIDETFTSSPEGFDSVQDQTVFEFPAP